MDKPLPLPDEPLVNGLVPAEPRPGSAAAILAAIKRGPHVTQEDVDELERLIEEGKLPPSEVTVFDEEPAHQEGENG